jgi:SAM-dependent methyltransferase
MSSLPTPDFASLKAGMKATWMAGDFGEIAGHIAPEGEAFVQRLHIGAGTHVLDIACGTGNTAIPAAKAGGIVTGIDIATNLLEQARTRATAAGVKIHFDEGDAEDLPYPDKAFDFVLTMFGAMFAPRPEKVAAELLRVCKPGGTIAMANWTPESFVGKTFQATSKLVPPPPGIPPPLLWGSEEIVRQRFSHGVSDLRLTRQNVHLNYPLAPAEMVGYFRQYFGPTQTAFARLDPSGQVRLAAELSRLWMEFNTATDGTTSVLGEYLEVQATCS